MVSMRSNLWCAARPEMTSRAMALSMVSGGEARMVSSCASAPLSSPASSFASKIAVLILIDCGIPFSSISAKYFSTSATLPADEHARITALYILAPAASRLPSKIATPSSTVPRTRQHRITFANDSSFGSMCSARICSHTHGASSTSLGFQHAASRILYVPTSRPTFFLLISKNTSMHSDSPCFANVASARFITFLSISTPGSSIPIITARIAPASPTRCAAATSAAYSPVGGNSPSAIIASRIPLSRARCSSAGPRDAGV
mmetsp:Transcript_18823/g.47309  ORF Transcript_18823/g.47309 Transcript_18823/m.47309 type:complete len:261 (+) Transcript_18823:265-1047(+)